MNVLIPFLLFLLIGYFVPYFLPMSKTVMERYTNTLCYISFFIIVLLAAFRGETVGADTVDYIEDYEDVKLMSFTDIDINYEGYLGYYYLSKIFAAWGVPIWLWFAFSELLFVSAIGRLIFSYSRERLYSVILFVVLGHFLFSMAGMKQILAMSLIIHSFLDLVGKKYLRSFLLIPIAYFFHPVVMIFVVAHILFLLRNTKIFYPIALALPVIVAVGAMSTLAFMVMVMDNSHFETYLEEDNSYSSKTLILYVMLLSCTLPCLPAYFRKNAVAKFELACLALALAFQYLSSTVAPSIFRIGYMFTIFYFTFLPNAFSERKGLFIDILRVVALMGAVFFFIWSNRGFVYTLME